MGRRAKPPEQKRQDRAARQRLYQARLQERARAAPQDSSKPQLVQSKLSAGKLSAGKLSAGNLLHQPTSPPTGSLASNSLPPFTGAESRRRFGPPEEPIVAESSTRSDLPFIPRELDRDESDDEVRVHPSPSPLTPPGKGKGVLRGPRPDASTSRNDREGASIDQTSNGEVAVWRLVRPSKREVETESTARSSSKRTRKVRVDERRAHRDGSSKGSADQVSILRYVSSNSSSGARSSSDLTDSFRNTHLGEDCPRGPALDPTISRAGMERCSASIPRASPHASPMRPGSPGELVEDRGGDVRDDSPPARPEARDARGRSVAREVAFGSREPTPVAVALRETLSPRPEAIPVVIAHDDLPPRDISPTRIDQATEALTRAWSDRCDCGE